MIDRTHQHCIIIVYIIREQPGGGGRRYPVPTFSRVLCIIRITFSDETNVKVTPQEPPSDLASFLGLSIYWTGLKTRLPVTLRAYVMYCLVFCPRAAEPGGFTPQLLTFACGCFAQIIGCFAASPTPPPPPSPWSYICSAASDSTWQPLASTSLHPTFSRVLYIITIWLFCSCVPLYWNNP